MAGRALVFSNPEIVKSLRRDFVPYAGDQWYLHRQGDADGAFFWKVADQGHNKDRSRDVTRQGIYLASAEGELYGSINSWSAERTLALMQSSLEKASRSVGAPIASETSPPDAQYDRAPPEGGLVVDLLSRIALARAPGGEWTPNEATGRDHLWLTRDEIAMLAPVEWMTPAAS